MARRKSEAVTSGDCLVIMALSLSRAGPPPEKTVTLSSVMAPKMVSLIQVLPDMVVGASSAISYESRAINLGQLLPSNPLLEV
ncbi:unnamed protein product [Arabidopsis lyrata]|nr:unnamed protein product [Arabidopsis lyrata]